MKVLVVSFAGIGDTLFATPLIHELRANFPEATIDVLVRWAGSKGLLENNPHLNTVYQKDIAKDFKIGGLAFLFKLRRKHYDFSINTFPASHRAYRFVAEVINAKTRIGHDYGNFTGLDRFMVSKNLPVDYAKHAVENNLALLQFLGEKPRLSNHRYEIFLADAVRATAEDYVRKQDLDGRPLFGIHVGTGGTKNLALRRWPLENYIELARQLRKKSPELGILFFGGPGEKQDHQKIQAAAGTEGVFFPNTKSMLESAALIGKCDLFLSVDSSLMHFAAAMGVPNQIVIETPTWNKPIEPYGNPFILVKNPSVAGRNLEFYRYDGRPIKGTAEELTRIMASVKVEDVLATVLKLI